MICKEDFKVLFEIEFLNRNNIDILIGRIAESEKEVKLKLGDLKQKGLIMSDELNPENYALTEKGMDIWNDENNLELKGELGF